MEPFTIDEYPEFSDDRIIVKELEAGQQVDQFRIVRKLGQGGMSEVYLARDTVLGRKVALKLIRADLVDTPKRLRLFLHEARLTARFSHPHIITIYSVGDFEGHPYLALEYLEGQTLSQRMREGAMSARETMRNGLAIAQALEEAHSHGVLHRDLKPANVIIAKDGRLRVLDFGISKIVEDSFHPSAQGKELAGEIKQEETLLGEIKGTPSYMAPERWLGETVTGKSDVWALGIILFQALTQVHPFLGADRQLEAIARRIVSVQNPPSLLQYPNVPSELSQLISSMLENKTTQRPTAKQVVEVLQRLLQHKRTHSFERGSPFRGLLPFSERHADLFFGRSAEIEMAVERLRNEPILPIVGPSGAGKSSFVAAGVVPRLRDMDRWLVLTVRPGTEPFGALSAVILAAFRGDIGTPTSSSGSASPNILLNRSAVTTPEETAETKTLEELKIPRKSFDRQETQSSDTQREREISPESLGQKLLENPSTLLLELQALAEETRVKVLLFVDQLEELYTHTHAPDLRLAYMEAICQAADDPEGPIRVVLTLREDFLGRVTGTSSAQEVLSRITVLKAMGDEALQEVVTKPLELAGYSYEDSGLPEEMLDAVRDAPSSLPLLQFACNQLWIRRDLEKRQLTRAAYLAMGGVEGALASEADELLAGLSEVQQRTARQLLLRLVTPDGTRRVMAAEQLLDGLDSSAALVLDRLTTGRMVVSRRAVGQESTGAELELVHDSLIHSWKPLVRWLEQSREEVVFLDELSRAAELWETRGRPREEVWSGKALDEALIKIERCDAVTNRVKEFLEAGEELRLAQARGRRKIVFAVFCVLLTVIAVLAYVIREVSIQRELAENQREIAVTERERQQEAHASALREGAWAAYSKGNFLEARSKLRGSLEARDSSQARALWWLLENEPLVWSKSLDSSGIDVSVSPDGRLVAVSSHYINIYDTKTLERRILSGHSAQVRDLDFSLDGQTLLSSAYDRELRLWDLRQGTVKVLKGHTGGVYSAVFSPDGKLLVSGSNDKTIKIWDTESATLIRTLENGIRVRKLGFAPDGRFIISAQQNGKLHFLNTKHYQIEQFFEEKGTWISDAVISTNGKLLAYGCGNGVLVVRDLETQQECARLTGVTNYIHSLSFSSDGDSLAASTRDGKVLIWDTKTWSLQRQFQHSKDLVSSVSFLPEGKQLVSTGDDGTLKLWNMNARSFYTKSSGKAAPIYALAFSPNGKTLVTGGSSVDGEIHLWEVASGFSIRNIQGPDADIYDIAFHPKGKLFAVGAADESIKLYTFPESQLLKTLYGHNGVITSVLFSLDGKQLISSSLDQTILFWDLERLTLKKSISAGVRVRYVDISPDGRLLAVASPERVTLTDIETGQAIRTFSGHTDIIFGVSFSPDGKSLYSSSRDHTVRRYLLDNTRADGEVVARHLRDIYHTDVAHISEDILGTTSADRTAKIWRIDSGEVFTLKGHRGEVNSLRFSPDGTRVATVSDDSTLRLWDTKTGQPLWRAPLMLEEPPLLATGKGWISFADDGDLSPSTKQWQKAIEARAKITSATGDQETLCLVTFGDELEIWNIPHDEFISKTKQPGTRQVLAIRKGCLTRSDESLTLTKTNGQTVTLGKQAEAMTRSEDSVFVLQGGNVRTLDLEGNQQDEFHATIGATALTLVGDTLALGFPEGRIEIWSREGSHSERVFICGEPEGNPVTTLIPGPPGTIIAGFEQGAVGIWSIETGERLFAHRLHGPVIHLLLRDQKLYAATELGSKVLFDLSMFYIEYCELMERIWSMVPWIWQESRARYREIPSDHECARRQ